jgi:hypothetical protein
MPIDRRRELCHLPATEIEGLTLIWHSAGRSGHCIAGGFLACAKAESGSSAQHAASKKRVTGT